jgi:hypothetical protein
MKFTGSPWAWVIVLIAAIVFLLSILAGAWGPAAAA